MAAGTKIGEVYAEIFVKINEASRKAAMAGVATEMRSAFDDAFNDIDKRSSQSTNKQVNNNKTVKKAFNDTDSAFQKFSKSLTNTGTQGETVMHRLATSTRTVGTLFRALSVGAKVIGGANLLLQAFQGLVAVVPIVQAGLLAIPALVAGAAVEGLLLKTAFKGVGQAISDAGTNTAAFQKDLSKLAPAAQTFVLKIAQIKSSLPNIQQDFFSAPQMKQAAGRLQGFFNTLHSSIARLATANGSVIGSILGTATNSAGAKLTAQFLNNISAILNRIRPGLDSVTHGFQVLIAKVSGEGASRASSLNGALEQFGNFLTRIDVKGIFAKASTAIAGFKQIAGLAWDIIKGIVKDLGGSGAVTTNFFTTVQHFLLGILNFVNSGSGKAFVSNISAVVQALGTISSATFGASLQAIGLLLGLVVSPLKWIASFAKSAPAAFNAIVIGIAAVTTAFKIYGAVTATVTALNTAFDLSLDANPIGLFVVAIVALGVGLTLLLTHFQTVQNFLSHGWVQAVVLAIAVFFPFIGLPLLIISHWGAILHFFEVSLPHAFSVSAAFIAGWGVNIKNWAINTVNGVLRVWAIVSRFFVVTIPNALNAMANWFGRIYSAIVGATIGLANRISALFGIIGRFFTKTVPGALNAMANFFGRIYSAITNATGGLIHNIEVIFNTVLRFFRVTVAGGLSRLSAFATSIWQGMYSNVLRFFINPIKSAFNTTVNAIKTTWSKIQGFIAGPVNWVKTNVYNRVLVPLWDNIVAVLPGVGKINKLAEGGPAAPIRNAGGGSRAAFANGGAPGRVRGPGGPRQDLIPAMLSNGEYVIREATVRKLGTSFFDALNATGVGGRGPNYFGDTHGGILTGRNHFSDGGGVSYAGNLTSWLEGGARITQSGKQTHATHGQSATQVLAFLRGIANKIPYRLGSNGPSAFDCSSLVGEVWARLTGHPHNRRYFVTGSSENSFLLGHGFKKGVRVKDSLLVGQNGEHTVGVLDGHRFEAAHTGTKMRFDDGATNALSMPQKYWMPTTGGGSLLSGVLGFIESIAGKGLTYLMKPIQFAMKKIPGLKGVLGHKLGDAAASPTVSKNLLLKSVTSLGGLLTKKVDEKEKQAEAALAAQGGGSDGGGPSNLRLGHGAFNAWMMQASKYTNIPSAWLPGLLRIMQGESGGNPNAVNNSDSNAKAGHPSQGLMQLIPSTFASNVHNAHLAHLGIRNPVANIVAAVNYIRGKYGSPFNTPWYHGQTFYKEGGAVQPKLYDSGGVLSPGYTLALNKTGHDEYVTTSKPRDSLIQHIYIGEEKIGEIVNGKLNEFQNSLITKIVTM